ncbi:MAG TPA: hypothetical protein VGM36_17090, partial [Rhizomicrobium sp.]
MFSYAESDPVLSKEQLKREEPALRTALLRAQYARLASGKRSLLLVIAGIDGAGKGAAINLLSEWMDPRHIHTIAFHESRDKHRREPDFERYWINLPANGESGVVFGSWYWPLARAAYAKKRNADRIESHARAIRKFEATLCANGVQVVKLWFHLSKQAQAARTKRLLSDPETAWQVQPDDIKVVRKFDRLRQAGEETLRLTDAAHAPWTVIPSADEPMRSVATGHVVLAA